MPTDTLLGLADRAEAATGPSRELNALIYVATHPGSRIATDEDRAKDGDIPRWDIMEANWIGDASKSAPKYTHDLREAISLIPADFAWHIQWVGIETHKASASVWLPPARTKGWANERFDCHEAATPELAIVAAALRARAHQEKDHEPKD